MEELRSTVAPIAQRYFDKEEEKRQAEREKREAEAMRKAQEELAKKQAEAEKTGKQPGKDEEMSDAHQPEVSDEKGEQMDVE